MDIGSGFVRAIVGAGVHLVSLGSEPIFSPCLLQMNQSALAWAVEDVLQGGNGQELGFREHGGEWNMDFRLRACTFKGRVHA